MKDIIFIFLIIGIPFLHGIIQQFKIDGLKEELKLEKAKIEFYKNRRN